MTENGVADALFARILRAANSRQTFRVFIFIPLLPAFPAKKGNVLGAATKTVTNLNLTSLSRGDDSLMGRLKCAGVTNPERYVGVFSLRSCGELACDPNAEQGEERCRLATELVYIHSKIMIIDDVKVLCGSANINDRSLIGSRDSELAFVLEDAKCEVASKMDGKNVMVGKFGSSLRRHLFAEHLGQVRTTRKTILFLL